MNWVKTYQPVDINDTHVTLTRHQYESMISDIAQIFEERAQRLAYHERWVAPLAKWRLRDKRYDAILKVDPGVIDQWDEHTVEEIIRAIYAEDGHHGE